MKKAHLLINQDFKLGKVSDRLFGSFVEHMGSVVYNGIYEPGHPQADKNGFRRDVLELVKELQLSVVRYPGGNFSSGYNWEDTVGPQKNRPVRLDLAWRACEPNTFGLNEFITWSDMLGVEPVITINLGTRGIDAARNIVEYCNFSHGSFWSDLRKTHGCLQPHRIKTWCLGNELDGEWQIAKKSAAEYGRLACEAAKVMKSVDPGIELVAVGSSTRRLPSYPEWDRTVLMHTYDHVEYLSLHNYIDKEEDDDTAAYLARPLEMEKQIKEIIAACDYVQAVKRSNKTMYLSFDEWNVHRNPEVEYEPWQTGSPFDWCRFNMEDTLVFSSMLLTLLRNAARVKIACQALLVNTIPLILTEKNGTAWRNPTFYPLLHASLYGRGEVLGTVLKTPKYDTKTYTGVPVVDTVAIFNQENKTLTVLAINKSKEPVLLKIGLQGLRIRRLLEHIELSHEDLKTTNTKENPDKIKPVLGNNTVLRDQGAESLLQPYSWNVVRFAVTAAK